MTTNKSQYLLENLGCAHCAAKMEEKLALESGIVAANINFVTKKLTLELEATLPAPKLISLEKIQQIVSSIESGVVVIDCDIPTHIEKTKDIEPPKKDQPTLTSKFLHKENLLKILTLIVGPAISFSTIAIHPEQPYFLLFFLLGYLLLSYEVILTSARNILHGEIFDENFLMMIATVGAIIIKEYPEAIAVMLLYQIGELFQDMAVDKSRKHLAEAMNIKPEYANIQTADGILKVSPESVMIGDIILIRPSEKIPLDGIVTQGNSFIDTSSLTGESIPKTAVPGDEVLSGCINGSGTLFIQVTTLYKDSTVAKVLDLIENASSRKSKTASFITKFAKIYTPLVVLAALLIALIPPIVTGSYDFNPWLYKACGFLVISCPCALVISVPLGFFGGIGCASKQGIIVKGGNFLEALSQVETVVFDKTGTLTQGNFEVSEIVPASEYYSQEDLLYYAAIVESFSTHPIAKSIVKAYDKPLDTTGIKDYKEIAGLGIRAQLNDTVILIGNSKLMNSHTIDIPSLSIKEGTTTYIAINNQYAGLISVTDIIKPDAADTIAALKSKKIKTVLLTGDSKSIAEQVAKKLGIDEVHAELLPADKVSEIETILSQKSSHKNVVFVGDGINDAPVIARSDVGFAMGGVGSDAAVEAADIVIMNDEPSKVVAAITIAKRTRLIVSQNIYMALGIKLVVLLLLIVGYTSLWLAVFADVGVSLLAIMNSIRVLNTKTNLH